MTDEINDYKADAELTPRRRGRPVKAVSAEPVAEAPAPLAEEAPAQPEPVSVTYVSPQVRLEIEAGRRALGLA